MLKTGKALALFIACLSLLLALAGCGGKADDASGGADTTAAAADTSVETDGTEAPGTQASDTAASDKSETTASGSTGNQSTTKAATTVTSRTAAPVTTAPPTTATPVNQRRNLCSDFLNGVEKTNKDKMYDWDKANKYVTCSKSLECSWGNGYGKAWLFDGKKATPPSELLFNVGAWVSCTIMPGWGEKTGDIYPDSKTYKRADLDEWLIIDLQKTYSIDQVNFSTLYKAADRGMPTAFTIQASTDKQTWKTVHTETNYYQDTASDDQKFPFTAVNARYVKIHMTKGASQTIDPNLVYCAALTEVEVWGK